MRILKPILFTAAMAVVFTSCRPGKDEIPSPATPNPPVLQQELITTVRVHLVNSMDASDQKVLLWRDLDGEGGNPPVITWDTLSAGVLYQAHIELLDESVSPPEDITEEIEEDDDEHQFFFIVADADATIAYADADGDGNPIGLETLWTVGVAGTGTVTIILRHELDKFAAGVAAGDITNAGGDTDVEVTFPLIIQ